MRAADLIVAAHHVIHPHGYISIMRGEITSELLDITQADERSNGKWLLPTLVMPGEETSEVTREARERLSRQWRTCDVVIVIGYRFGIGAPDNYDTIWREEFVEAMTDNRVPIHVVCPDAFELRGHLAELLKRELNVLAWPFSWQRFSAACITIATERRTTSLAVLARHCDLIERAYDDLR